MVTVDRTMTFMELDASSNSIAAAIRVHGIRPGQTVSLYAQNRWEWLVAYHGILKSAAVVNPINVMLTVAEVEYVLRDCQAAAIFVGEGQAAAVLDVVANLPHECSAIAFGPAGPGAVRFEELIAQTHAALELSPTPDEPCTIGYPSGTTGRPKGAVHPRRCRWMKHTCTGCRPSIPPAMPAPYNDLG